MSSRNVFLVMITIAALICTGLAHSLPQSNDTFVVNDLSTFSASNTSMHSTHATCISPGLLNPTAGDAILPCDCYGYGHDADRYYMVLAIELFCERTSGKIWSGADFGGLMTAYQSYWFNKDNTIEGISVILVKLDFWADQLGTQSKCDPEFVIDYDTCVKSMHVPLDQCDTSRENRKHGGQATSGCLLWTLDSDPQYNNREIYSSLTMPPSVWPTPPAKL